MKRAWTAVFLMAGAVGAEAQSSAALDEANENLASAWNSAQSLFVQGLNEAVEGLEGQDAGPFEITQAGIVQLDLSSPPAFRVLTPAMIYMEVPDDDWTFGVQLQLTLDLWFFEWNIPVQAAISDLQVRLLTLQNLSDPFRPRIAWVQPWIRYSLSLSSSNSLVNVLLNLFETLLDNSITETIANLALTYFVNDALMGLPGAPPGENDPFLYFAPPADMGAAALEMRAQDLAAHLPNNMLVDVLYNPNGTIYGYARHGDSTIYTGHFLAAMAFCYDETGDPGAVTAALQVAQGIRRCLDVGSSPTYQIGTQAFVGPALPAGAEGRLVRYAAAPGELHQGTTLLSAYYTQSSQNNEREMSTAIINGGLWYGHPKPISRDQYIGVVQGLAFAHARRVAHQHAAGIARDRVAARKPGHAARAALCAARAGGPRGTLCAPRAACRIACRRAVRRLLGCRRGCALRLPCRRSASRQE